MNHIKASIASFALTVSFTTSVSQAQTIAAAQELAAEKPMTIFKAHSVTSGNLTLTGNQQGQAILRNTLTDSTVTFQADAGKWVREVFLLDGGKTVGASQADHTVFWNVTNSQQIGRIEARVYGFSHNQKLCFAQTPGGMLQLYAYPSLKLRGRLNSVEQKGADEFLFSPDDHYLMLQITRLRPESEADYPKSHFAFHSYTNVNLYNLIEVREIIQFARFHDFGMETFTPDSRCVVLHGIFARPFDLTALPGQPSLFYLAGD